jgi:hypothetical protein
MGADAFKAVRELGFVSVCELEVELEPGAS